MYDRVEINFTDVGTTWSTKSVNTPKKYQVKRVRVFISSGDGSQVAFRIQEETTSSIKLSVAPIDTALEYALEASLDYVESYDDIIVMPRRRTSQQQGLSYMSVKCDAGTNNEVSVRLDIEELS